LLLLSAFFVRKRFCNCGFYRAKYRFLAGFEIEKFAIEKLNIEEPTIRNFVTLLGVIRNPLSKRITDVSKLDEMKKKFSLFILLSVFLTSCYKEETILPFLGYEYFPSEIGSFIEYRVDSLWQDDPAGQLGSGGLSYDLREVNESNFTDEANREAVRLERYWKQNGQAEWSIKDIWHKVRTPNIAEQNEDNVVFVKHNFPVEEGKSWDGNARNTLETLQLIYLQQTILEEWSYTYINVNEPYTINGFTFDSTVTVLQLDRPAAFGLNVFAQEVYAKNIGLVHKQLKIYDIQPDSSNALDKDSVGFIFEMVITDWGQ